MKAAALLVVAGCASNRVVPPPVPLPDQALRCSATDEILSIDGFDAESSWRVTPATRLLPSLGDAGGQARCLYNDLGMAIYATGQDTYLRATITEHDGRTWDDDVFELFVQPGDGDPYFEFHVTPAGTTLDMRLPAPQGTDARSVNDPVFHQRSAVHVVGTLNDDSPDTEWSAELFIPWSDLDVDKPTPTTRWTGHVARYDYAADGTYALASTAPFTEVGFHRRHEWPAIVF